MLRLSSGRPTARPPPRSHVDAKRESVSATRLKTKLKRKVSFARPGASAAARHPIAQGRGASAAAVDVASEGAVRVRLHRPAPGEPLGLGLVSLGGTGSIAIACLAHGSAAAASGLLRPLDVLLSIGGKEPASCERAYEMLAAAAGEVDLVVRRRPNANGACRPAGLRATTRLAVLVPKPRPGESLGIVLYKCAETWQTAARCGE